MSKLFIIRLLLFLKSKRETVNRKYEQFSLEKSRLSF